MLKIFGAKGSISDIDVFLKQIESLSDKFGLFIQVIDADYIYGKKHLLSAVNHTKRAFLQKTNSLNSLSLELLLYISGERQIKKAIKKIGLKKSTKNIAFVLISDDKFEISEKIIKDIISNLNLTRDDNVLEGNKDTLIIFGINNYEIETVSPDKYSDLILEKVALVDIIK